MKSLLCGLLSLSALAGLHAGTAYEALRVIGKQRGDAALDRVVEVRGSKGVSQPRTWKVVVLDKLSETGVREFDVQGTSVSGERSPQSDSGGETMNMGQLNLDSDGAHTVAEREAKKGGFAYDHVNYSLRSGAQGGSPVWEVRLVDEQNGNVATLSMAADTGKLLRTEGLNKGSAPQPRVAENRRSVAREEIVEEPMDEERVEVRRRVEERRVEERERERDYDDGRGPVDKVTGFFDRAGRHIGGAFQRFGTKVERTFGSPPPRRVVRRSAPAPVRSSRDSGGTEYYRPRD